MKQGEHMKLSEAIRLGAMMKPQAFIVGGDGTCALQAALDAIGMDTSRPSERTDAIWPQALSRMSACPECKARATVAYIIPIHLNDRHRWTRERIADWVATVEPQEVESVTPAEVADAATV
jgi:hypothetical protein